MIEALAAVDAPQVLEHADEGSVILEGQPIGVRSSSMRWTVRSSLALGIEH
jgi:hypothetical protein